jgi:hypothetical protein
VHGRRTGVLHAEDRPQPFLIPHRLEDRQDLVLEVGEQLFVQARDLGVKVLLGELGLALGLLEIGGLGRDHRGREHIGLLTDLLLQGLNRFALCGQLGRLLVLQRLHLLLPGLAEIRLGDDHLHADEGNLGVGRKRHRRCGRNGRRGRGRTRQQRRRLLRRRGLRGRRLRGGWRLGECGRCQSQGPDRDGKCHARHADLYLSMRERRQQVYQNDVWGPERELARARAAGQ